ncbi:MAG: aminopeptidase P family protein [bacterium]
MKLINILFFITSSLMFAREEYNYPYKDGIPANIFKQRREIVNNHFQKNTILLLLSADYFSNTSDFYSGSSVSPNLYYLSGIPPQRAVLVLVPSGIKINGENISEILFLKEQTQNDIKWNGYKMNIADAGKILQIQKVMNLSALDSMLKEIVKDKDTLFFDKLSRSRHFSNDENHTECDIEIINKIKTNYPEMSIKTNIPLLSEMRRVKDKEEIKLIQKAVDISIEGHKALINSAKPGVIEYQLQAEMEYQFQKNGAERPAYGSIIGSGRNSCFLHYQNNRDTVKDGDVILFDCGAKYHGYCADITRTIPANGTFSIEQKIIYNIVLEAMDSAFAQCKPGNKFTLIHEKAKELISEKLLEQSIITEKEDVDVYFPHGTSHFLGLNVHDSGPGEYLEEGNVLTVEPGIYIPAGSNYDERWWNIGIRIEDDVLITKEGFINLSEKLPRTAEAIEKMMRTNR